MNAKQINKKYTGKYVDISKQFDYEKQDWNYTVNKVYKEAHENTTLGEDVGTSMEYRR